MPMLESCQHRAMTCGRHACMPIRRLMLLALQSAEGSVPSDVLAGFKRAESASTNCIITFNAIECRTHVKPSLPLRGTCWLPRHCRCPIMVSAYLSKTVRSIAWVWIYVFVTFFYYGFSACSGAQDAIWQEPARKSTPPRGTRVGVGARALTFLQNPARCSPVQPHN
jgi:hypothetical protein